MTSHTEEWEARLADVWARLDEMEPATFREAVAALTSELPAGSAISPFEQACAFDSTGHPDRAVPLYREALNAGLTDVRRRRAVIQLASSLRNVGHTDEALELLQVELRRPHDDLHPAVRVFLALTLSDLGRDREALQQALLAAAPLLPRYQRSVARYALALSDAEG